MTTTDLATTPAAGEVAELSPEDARRFSALWRECNRLALSKFVPSEYAGDTPTIFALARYGEALGLPPIHAIQRLNIISGRIDVPYDITLGVLLSHGHEVRMPETSSERCVVKLRRREDAGDPEGWQQVTYTIDDARRAGHLDIWVEEWHKTQSGKNWCETFKVGDVDSGVDQAVVDAGPEWVAKAVTAQKLKMKENWAKHPDDMLAAKAIRRAAKRFAPDAMLQLDRLDDGEEPPTVAKLAEPVAPMPDDEPVDGELVQRQGEPSTASAEDIEDAVLVEPATGDRIVGEEATTGTAAAPPSSDRTDDASTPTAPRQPVPMSDQQSRMMHALLREKRGAVGPARHAVLAELLGRPIASASELTASDASNVIDLLNDEPNFQPPTNEEDQP